MLKFEKKEVKGLGGKRGRRILTPHSYQMMCWSPCGLEQVRFKCWPSHLLAAGPVACFLICKMKPVVLLQRFLGRQTKMRENTEGSTNETTDPN